MTLTFPTAAGPTRRILVINSITARCTCGTWLGADPHTGELTHADACKDCHNPVSGETDPHCRNEHRCYIPDALVDPVPCAHVRCAGYAAPFAPCQYDHEDCCACCQPEYDHDADWAGLDAFADDFLVYND